MITPPQSPVCRAVRFDDSCILIPTYIEVADPQRPKLPGRSISLTGFMSRKKLISPMKEKQAYDDQTLQPSLSSRTGRQSSPTGSVGPPLQSCLVSAEVSRPKLYHRKSADHTPVIDPSLETIPLRPCCVNCVAATESAVTTDLTHFSRAARLRYDGLSSSNLKHLRRHSADLVAKTQKIEEEDENLNKDDDDLFPLPCRKRVISPPLPLSPVSVISEDGDDDNLFPLPRRSAHVPSSSLQVPVSIPTGARRLRVGGLLTPETSPALKSSVPTFIASSHNPKGEYFPATSEIVPASTKRHNPRASSLSTPARAKHI